MTTTGIIVAGPLLFWGGWTIGKTIYPTTTRQPAMIRSQQEQASQTASGSITTPATNSCSDAVELQNEADRVFCFQAPKLTEQKGLQIDLTTQKALLFDNGKIIAILPVAYQSPEGVWFQTPTGYFRAGVKHEKHRSSLFPVNMPYAVQLTEDFFMHEIPFYDDGTKVTSKFSGGCIRFETEVAKKIFAFLNTGDQIVIYKTFDDLQLKPELYAPINVPQYWIRQRFNSPLRSAWNHKGDLANIGLDYSEHVGVDFAPAKDATDMNVYAIADGTVIKVQQNNKSDHGMGATVIIEHLVDNRKIYSLYAHLSAIATSITEGASVQKGDSIGTVGNSAYGCQTFWKIGKDGCDSQNQDDIHLHFELKTAPVLENPTGGTACILKETGEPHVCYGYVPDDPRKYGYLDPLTFLFDKK